MNPYKGDHTAKMFLMGEIRAAGIILHMLRENRGPMAGVVERTAKYMDRLEETLEEIAV